MVKKFLISILLLPLLTFSLSYNDILKAYEKSYFYERIGDYKDAIRVLMPVYKEYPLGYTINLRLGWLYYLWGKYENSIFHYRRAVSAIPTSAEAKLGLSLPLMAQERWQDVEVLMYQIIATDYYNYYANLRLCTALDKQGKYYLEMVIARKMLALYPTSVPFLIALGRAYYNLKDYKAALETFKNALVLDPENNTIKDYIKKIQQRLNPPQKEIHKGNKTEG
jgi:tetratricopeptide (TPR) repeat protein